MKKKMLAVLLAGAMVASLTACGGSNSADTADTTKTEESGDSAEAADTKDASEFKVGLITDVGGVNDGSFNQSSWEGLERAGEELGVTVNYLESATDADYAPNMETFVDEDYDLIISVGYMLADATRAAAEANPDTKFAIIDDSSIDLAERNQPYLPCRAGFLSGRICSWSDYQDQQYWFCSWYDQRDHEPVRLWLLCRCY